GVALLHAVGTEERDAEIAVRVRSDDGLVVAGDDPGERLLGVGDRGRRPSPSKPAVLPFHRVGCLDVAHARWIGAPLRSRMMLIGAEDNRLAFSRPRVLEIGNCVLCARRSRRRAKKRQRKDEMSHRFLTWYDLRRRPSESAGYYPSGVAFASAPYS